MKPIMKSVIVLAAIAVVCTILLSLGNYFWPKKTSAELIREQIGELLKDTSITEVKDVDLSQFDSNNTVINAWTAYSGDTEIGTVLEVTGSVGDYGALNLFVGFSKASNKIINIQISKSGEKVFTKILHENYFSLFYEKDIVNYTANSVKTLAEGMTGASLGETIKTSTGIIVEAYKYYQVNFAKAVIIEKTKMQLLAIDIFGGDCEEEPVASAPQTFGEYTFITYTTTEGNTFYHLSGAHFASSDSPAHADDDFSGKPTVYIGIVNGKYKIIADKILEANNVEGLDSGAIAYINSKTADSEITLLEFGNGTTGATFTSNSVIKMINALYTNVLSV